MQTPNRPNHSSTGKGLQALGRASHVGAQALPAWFGWRSWLHSSAHIGSASQKVSGADVRYTRP